MATSGSLSTSKYDGRYYTLSWTATQSTTTNKSTIKWTLKAVGGNSSWYAERTLKVVIAGKTVYDKTDRKDRYAETIETGTITVEHDDNGDASFSASIKAAVFYSTVNCTGSKTFTLTNIPRKSTISSAANVTLGNDCSIKWTPKSSSFKYKIKFSLGSWEYTVPAKDNEYIYPKRTTAYTYNGYTIPKNNTTLLKAIPNKTGKMTATLYTYTSSGTTHIGSDPETFTVTVPSDISPTMGTITITPNEQSILLQNQNTITAKVSGCSAGTGSSIKNYTFTCLIGDTTIDTKTTTSTSVTFGPFKNTGSVKVKVKVTDNRTYTATGTSSDVACYRYTVPSFNSSFTAVREEVGTTDSTTGETKYKYNINWEYSIQNFIDDIADNKLTVKVYYQPIGGSKTLLGKYSVTNYEGTIADIGEDTTYTVWAEVYDTYTTTPIESNKVTIYASLRIMNIKSDGTFPGTGIGIGQKAKNVGFVESAYNIATTEAVNNVDVFDGNGYFMTRPPFSGESQNVIEPAIYRNLNPSKTKSNLWIGATAQGGEHFTNGSTYISTGSDTDIYVCKDVDGNGRSNYRVLDTENCYKFSDKMRIKMYANLSGSASNITFIDGIKASDFNFIEIYYKTNNDVGRKSTKAFLNKQTGLSVEISHCEPVSTENSIYIKTSLFIINDTTLTWKRGKYTKLSGTSSETIEYTENKILITGIYGYK